MKPIKFKEQNCTYAEDQPEYQNLPAYKDEIGTVISCWQLSFHERLRILLTGRLWLGLMTSNNPLTPSFLTTKKSELLISEKQTNNIIRKNVRLFYKLLNRNS